MAEESGYRVVGDRVLMPKFGADSVSINSSGVISVVKTNRAGARVRETTYLASHPGFNARLQRLLDQDEEEGIDSGKEWAFRIGDGNVFLRAHAQLATLLSYGHEVQFREPRAADYVQLVKVEYL